MTTTRCQRASGEQNVLVVGETPVTTDEILEEFDDDSVTVTVVRDGRRAIQWLTDTSKSEGDKQSPDTIVLTAGLESPGWPTLLRALNASPRLRTVPVLVLTHEEMDAEVVYANGGNAHVAVPKSPAAYSHCLNALEEFWVEWNQHPSEYLYGGHE